jgi:hypothetical protein
LAAAGWTVAAATRRGESHARRGERGQDALCLRLRGGLMVAVLADGAGSAPRGGPGAALACRMLAQAALAARHPLDETGPAPWLSAARSAIAAAAETRGLAPRDFAATLILAVSDGAATLVAHVGDGGAVALGPEGWHALSWPETGEYAGTTHFLTDDPPALRVTRHDGPVRALALFTDGLERLVLDFAAQQPHAPFFDRMTAPLSRSGPGRDRALSRALGDWLESPAVAARTDDDRTLLLARPLEAA